MILKRMVRAIQTAIQATLRKMDWNALTILFRIMLQILPFSLWFLISLLSLVVWLAILVLWIMLMVKAYQNQKLVIPVIGALAEKQA
jgi:uncharacterized membrane protein